MNTIPNTLEKKRLSIKLQTLAVVFAVVGAVAVPQLFHAVGASTGHGTALGETFLPMHLPIILAGLLAGPYAGAAAGLFGPLASFLLTGMPSSVMLPFMMIELCIYGMIAGMLRNAKMPCIAKVLFTQIGGRAVRAIAIAAAVQLLGSNIRLSVIWSSISTGFPGLVLQWTLIPLAVLGVSKLAKNEE